MPREVENERFVERPEPRLSRYSTMPECSALCVSQCDVRDIEQEVLTWRTQIGLFLEFLVEIIHPRTISRECFRLASQAPLSSPNAYSAWFGSNVGFRHHHQTQPTGNVTTNLFARFRAEDVQIYACVPHSTARLREANCFSLRVKLLAGLEKSSYDDTRITGLRSSWP
jgi:hypothetical protein